MSASSCASRSNRWTAHQHRHRPRRAAQRCDTAFGCKPCRAISHSDDAAAAALDSFDDLASLERRLAALDDGVVPKLRGFFDTELKSFALEPGVTRNYSVASSAICIGALLDADALDEFPAVTKALAEAPWRTDDLLQAPLVVSALARAAVGPPCTDRLAGAVEALLGLPAAPARLAAAEAVELPHVLAHAGAARCRRRRSCRIPGHRLNGHGLCAEKIVPGGARRALPPAGLRLDGRAGRRHTVAYSLATYASVGAARDQINAFATRDEVRCDGDGDRDGIEAPNLKLCARALDVFFGAQRDDGTWAPAKRYSCGRDGPSTSATPSSSATRRPRDGPGAAAAARGVPAARGEDRADLRLARAAGPRRARLAERPPRGGLRRAARVVDGAGAPVRRCGVKGRGRPAEQSDPRRVRRARGQGPRRDGVRRALGFGHGMLSVSSRSRPR